jgi:hypothetical protein
LNALFLVVHITQQKFAHGILFFLIPRQVSQRVKAAAKTPAAEIRFALAERLHQGRDIGGSSWDRIALNGGARQLVAV